ncbi:peptide chain release factor N(5)-glutamine methyltransferase [Jatrophihabitans sp.]|uniref:peptide chain release factor N(5)-glutamine methyltransferase n=1 Tax=Jatrophihabitans sp. TaxID=1932789 RepID=UPI0030C6A46F|nr:putative methyltransferase [Jatrophihabitans sp.]
MTAVRELLAAATATLAEAGVGSPRVDAELLLAHSLGVSRSGLLTLGPVADSAAYEATIARRAAREPLQHIVGSAPFRHLELAVGPGVFIPRPETELLIDAVLPQLLDSYVVVDLCSGSGALALSVLDEAPGRRVVAVERDDDALAWLRRNAAGSTLEVVPGDVADPNLLFELYGEVDVVLSNPPYVPETVTVDPEVRADPHAAVFAGADGLAVIPAVVARAAELLHLDGMLAMEHDDTQGESVPALLAADGRWRDIAVHADLTGRPRFTTARRCEPVEQTR